MAPEIVSKKEYMGGPADIWSCGVVLFVILTGNFPFKCIDEKGLFKKIQKGLFSHIPTNDEGKPLSRNAMDLLRSLLTVDASQRLTAEAALKH
jgi:serine/threonine-protein kinase HSL1, negative regulator of Swe1 kinase